VVNDVLKDKATDPDDPTDAELKYAIATSHNCYVVMGLLLHSDPKRYLGMVHDIKNLFTFGSDIYPEMLDEAYDYLVNYKIEHWGSHINQGGLSFLVDGDPNGGHRHGHGHGGCSSGCVDMGHGSKQGGPPVQLTTDGNDDAEPLLPAQAIKDSSHLQFLLNNELDKVDDYSHVIARVAHCHQSAHVDALGPSLLLLDSSSTVNLISNWNMLTGIHCADAPL